MDIAAALAPTPATPPKTDSASAPASATEQKSDASETSSFEDEFESASANSAEESEETSETSQDSGAAPDAAASPDNELLIEVEDQTVIADAIIAPEVEDAHNDEVVIAETAEPQITEPAVEEVIVEEAVEISAEAPVVDESEEPDAEVISTEVAVEDGDAPEASVADEPVIVPVVAASLNPAASAIAEQAAEDIAAAAPEEIEPFMDIREAREKPYMTGGADRLKTLHSFVPPQLADDAFIPAMSVSEHQFHSSAASKASVAIAHVDSSVVADQVVAAIRADRGAGSVDVRLDPPELGRVRIHFNMERADIVVATVSSERGETLDLLRRHSADLARELERAGFANVQLDFATGNDSAFANWDQPEQNGYDALPEAMAEEQIIAYVRKAQGRLDRFV